MVADNCRLSCQLDTLVLLTNRSAKLIRKCCKSGNYGYHFSLCGSLKDDTKPEKSSWQPPDFELRRMKFFRDNFQHFQKQFTHWLGDKQTIWALRFKPNFPKLTLKWILSLCKQNPTKPYRLRIWGILKIPSHNIALAKWQVKC